MSISLCFQSVFSSLPPRPPSTTETGYPDTPFEGRATPSSPDSQQPFESLKRELKFSNSEAAATTQNVSKPAVDLMKPVSFVEFEQKQQKVDGITRDVLNAAIKSLNAVFREKVRTDDNTVIPRHTSYPDLS